MHGSAGNGHMRSPSPLSAHRRQQNHPPEPRPWEQPPVVSGIGCRSGEGEGAASLWRRGHGVVVGVEGAERHGGPGGDES